MTTLPPQRAASPKPKPLEQVRQAIRTRHCARCTEEAFLHLIKRYIFFGGVRHLAEMGEPEMDAFLPHLAPRERVGASRQNQTLSAAMPPLADGYDRPTVRKLMGLKDGKTSMMYTHVLDGGGKGVRSPVNAL
ncbi:MAG: site-specific integrase [Candidatus Oleimicrobiaceae bacterium]